MFVRWKRRERRSRKKRIWKGGVHETWKPRLHNDDGRPTHHTGRTGKFLLCAVLVKSERRGGKPRQKTVAYLGSIPEGRAGDVSHRHWFWEAAGRKLDALGLDAAGRQEVEAALLARVARPTAEELEGRGRRLRELEERIGRGLKAGRRP
jgi:hypothetical protein